VVRDHGTLVVGDLVAEARAVADRVAAERHARLVEAPADAEAEVPRRAPGAYQRRNFAVARAAAEAFLGELDAEAVRRAADDVVVPGRMEPVASDPLTINDGAHNPSGAAALAEALPEVIGTRRPVVGVVAILDDKDAAGMLRELAPRFDRFVFTRSVNPRSLSPGTLLTLCEQLGGPPAEIVADAHEAVLRAREMARPDGAVVVTGSIYLVAELAREHGAARASAL
jgi:dihydrofolate synthase/folylpolyglutamate synthase